MPDIPAFQMGQERQASHSKLHAPRNTTVEGVFKGGKLETMKVVPESRAKDVEVMAAQ